MPVCMYVCMYVGMSCAYVGMQATQTVVSAPDPLGMWMMLYYNVILF